MKEKNDEKFTEEPTSIKLARAARKLFAEKGYPLTTTRMIAQKAKVAQSAISFHYGTKEELCAKVIEYTITLLQREYGSISNDISKKLLTGEITSDEAWDYIDRLISMQIDFSLEDRNSTTIKLMLNESSFPSDLSGKLSHAVYELIEGPLSQLILFVSDSKDTFNSAVLSRAINGAIFTFREKPVLAENVLLTASYSYDTEKLQTHLHRFLLMGLKNTVNNPNRVGETGFHAF